MKREELEHVIRAAGAITGAKKLVIVGSQSILGKHPTPANEDLTRSMEADLYPLDNPELSEVIDASIGQDSSFHSTFGYYADGVGPETATLPIGWESRLIPVENANTGGVTGLCLEPNDLALSKLAAGREKDLQFVEALVSCGYAATPVMRERVGTMPIEPAAMQKLFDRITSLDCKRKAGLKDYPSSGIDIS